MSATVLLEMFQQFKSTAAQFAPERSLLGMNDHMISQMFTVDERFTASRAHEITFAYVPFDVNGQTGARGKSLAAHVAVMLSQSFMQFFVNEQRSALFESFAAQIANVRTLSRVNASMVLHVAFV